MRSRHRRTRQRSRSRRRRCNTVTAAHEDRRRRARAGRRARMRGAAAEAAAQIAGVAKVLHRRRAAPRRRPGRERRRAGARRSRRATRHILAPATASGKNIMPRVAAQLDVAQISDIIAVESRRHLRAPDLRRQRDRHGAAQRRDQGDHRAHDRLRRRRPPTAAARRSRRVAAAADCGQVARSSSRELTKSDRPELTAAQDHRLRRPRHGQRRELHKVLEPLADKLGAALGASRAAVDAGYVPND